MSAECDEVRKRLREKLGLPASVASALSASFDSQGSGSAGSVLHRILEIEDKRQLPEPELTPLPEALVHSLSASWKPLMLEDGKSAWQRDDKTGLSTEVVKGSIPATPSQKEPHPAANRPHSQPPAQRWTLAAVEQTSSGSLVLHLPEVQTIQQAQDQVDQLQQQAFQRARKLHEARVLARQAAEQLLTCQAPAAHSVESPTHQTDRGQQKADEAAETLKQAQTHMLEASEQASMAELVAGLAEARARFLENAHAEGHFVPDTPHDSLASDLERTGSFKKENAQHSSSPKSALSTAFDPSNTVGVLLPGGGLSALRLALDLPLQTSDARPALSADRTPRRVSVSTPRRHSRTLTNETKDRSFSAPNPLTSRRSSDVNPGTSASAQENGKTLLNDSSEEMSADSNTIFNAVSQAGLAECGSISAATILTSTASSELQHEDLAGSGDLHKQPLPELPDYNNAAGKGYKGQMSSKYMQIGCAAVAYVCLAAVWAKGSSAIAFANYLFPT